jgi:hypothetical protein
MTNKKIIMEITSAMPKKKKEPKKHPSKIKWGKETVQPKKQLNSNQGFNPPKRLVTFKDGGDNKYTVDVVHLLKKMLDNQTRTKRKVTYTTEEAIVMMTLIHNYTLDPA